MKVTHITPAGAAQPIPGPADLSHVSGGVVVLSGSAKEPERTKWAAQIGFYVTRSPGGRVQWQ